MAEPLTAMQAYRAAGEDYREAHQIARAYGEAQFQLKLAEEIDRLRAAHIRRGELPPVVPTTVNTPGAR